MSDLITIDWNLGNSCNLQCSYCHKDLYNGENPFPIIERLGPAFDHLIDQCGAFSHVRLEFSGGEPTQSDAIQQIILKNTNDKIKFKLISNAQASLNWWNNTAHHLYDLTLTYHASTDFNHFLQVVNLVKPYTNPKIYIPTTSETWESQRSAYDQLKSQGYNAQLQLLYSNFTRGNNDYLKYSQDQWAEYYKENGIDINVPKQVESTVEFKRVHNLNNFYGHLCWAGVDQIVIDNFGDVWRGWCKSTLCLGNVFEQTVCLDQKPRPCPKQQCRNGFDLQAHKSQGSWGMA